MLIELERRDESSIPVEVEGIIPETLDGQTLSTIARLPIWSGRNQVELREVFHISAHASDEPTLVWSGRLNNVHWIGAGMKMGRIEIRSSAGRHVGSGMQGGLIAIQGDVSDFAGAEMTGGQIRISGNAADHLGGCYPGSKRGMNRGEIMVEGNGGHGVGQRMRRGLIAVNGNVGRLCGWSMLAGTILVGGQCGRQCGLGMVRGTIIQLRNPTSQQMDLGIDSQSNPQSEQQTSIRAKADPNADAKAVMAQGSMDVTTSEIHEALVEPADHPLPTFTRGNQYQQAVLNLIAVRLQELGFHRYGELTKQKFRIYHGDHLNGGRGELLIAEEASQEEIGGTQSALKMRSRGA